MREIVTPHKSLLTVQQWICKHILSTFQIHPSAYAYIKKKNVAKNATLHIGCNKMLKIDLKNFFPSINIARVRELFNRKGYSKEVSAYLSYLCCLEGSIPQGAGSSPIISNIIFYTLDKKLNEYSVNHKITYSRYSDDLVFSGNKFHYDFKNSIISLIINEGFSINYKKLKEYTESHRKLVNGVLVKKNEIRLQKSIRIEIKEQVYYILRYGILDQVKRHNDIYYIDRILGRLGYWKQIEPNNEFVITSIKKINQDYKKILLND
jgi:retron-type reverse transcriptase